MSDIFGIQAMLPLWFWQFILVLFIFNGLVQLFIWVGIFGGFVWKVPPATNSLLPITEDDIHQKYKENHTKVASSVTSDIMEPPVSIIICAHNEAENIRQCLPYILQQKYTAYEVIVVNDASTDHTLQILHELAQAYDQLSVIHIAEKITKGKKTALAIGIEAAKNPIILLTDADCLPASPHWISLMTKPLQGSFDLVLGYSPFFPKPHFLNTWCRFETFYTALQYLSIANIGYPYMGVGRNIAYRKSLYTSVGGFEAHKDIASGDDDLFVNAAATAMNTTWCIEADAFVYSYSKTTHEQYTKQKKRHFSTAKNYHISQQIGLTTIALSHSLHFLFLAILLLAQFSMVFVLCFHVIRFLTIILVSAKACQRFQEKSLLKWLILFDPLLAVFYTIFAPSIFFHNNNTITWT